MGEGRKSLSAKTGEQNWSRALPGYTTFCLKYQSIPTAYFTAAVSCHTPCDSRRLTLGSHTLFFA